MCPQTNKQTHSSVENKPTKYIFKQRFYIICFLAWVNFNKFRIHSTFDAHAMFSHNQNISMDHWKTYEDKLKNNLCRSQKFITLKTSRLLRSRFQLCFIYGGRVGKENFWRRREGRKTVLRVQFSVKMTRKTFLLVTWQLKSSKSLFSIDGNHLYLSKTLKVFDRGTLIINRSFHTFSRVLNLITYRLFLIGVSSAKFVTVYINF